jgi:hypothetical protein
MRDTLCGVEADYLNNINELAGGPGFEPRLEESESTVLPLNYPPPRHPYRRAKVIRPACLTRCEEGGR